MKDSQKTTALLKTLFFIFLFAIVSCNPVTEKKELSHHIFLEAISYPKDSQSMQIFEVAEPIKQYFP